VNGNCVKEAGYINIRALFWLLLLSASIYGAYKFVPPYVGFYLLKTEVEEEARTAHMYTDAVLASRITGKAASWSVTLGPQNMAIVRGMEHITITVDYTVDLVFFDRYERSIDYHILVREPLKEKGRFLQ
jgi:hypothetical protein